MLYRKTSVSKGPEGPERGEGKVHEIQGLSNARPVTGIHIPEPRNSSKKPKNSTLGADPKFLKKNSKNTEKRPKIHFFEYFPALFSIFEFF